MWPLLLIAILSALVQLFLPWWSIALVAFGVCFWRSRTGWQAFGAGFGGIAVVWFLYALFIHLQTDNILTGRMADLFFKTQAPVLLLLITPLIGGLVGGFAALAGRQLKDAVAAKP
ncbi:hypothetical protein ACFPMF_14865 [Larkinella bovis]|uniref:Uncharacterized protein n=1 Tax=Larkinella bovis TaxID=683041 RepID=A0ABW0IGX0_9BACT